jgi:hypothetical protein
MTPALSAHEPGKRKSTVDFQVAGMKRDLAQWLDQKCGAKDSTAIRMALLEVALDRYLAERAADLADLPPVAADATDMMQVVLRRAVQRRREELQDNKRPLEGTAGPADDEECANRLINTLTLLDRLAGHVPDHLVSREELESASEILALLVGWFAGGIGGPPSGEDMPAAGGHPWGK